MLSINFLFPEITWTADKFRQANAITCLFSSCEGNISLTSKTLKEEFMPFYSKFLKKCAYVAISSQQLYRLRKE